MMLGTFRLNEFKLNVEDFHSTSKMLFKLKNKQHEELEIFWVGSGQLFPMFSSFHRLIGGFAEWIKHFSLCWTSREKKHSTLSSFSVFLIFLTSFRVLFAISHPILWPTPECKSCCVIFHKQWIAFSTKAGVSSGWTWEYEIIGCLMELCNSIAEKCFFFFFSMSLN